VADWDVFHADRLELERGLSGEAIRSAVARGELRDDDLVRPSGTTVPWARLADLPELMTPPAPVQAPGPLSPPPGQARREPEPVERLQDFEEVQPSLEEIIPAPKPHHATELPSSASPSDVAFPVLEEQPEPRAAPDPGSSAAATSFAWSWDDDEDGDEDDKDDSLSRQDLGDIEILADEGDLDDPGARAAGTKGRERASRSSPSRPSETETRTYHGEPDPRAAATQRWEPGEEDLVLDTRPDSRSSHVALPVVRSRDRDGEASPEGDDEEPEAPFSLSRSATQRIEELDLAPMVDVAFQLVLFFMVTATTVLYKTLEIPKPSGEAPAGAVAQGRSRSLDDLKDDYILVEIDEQGAMKLDREPIEPAMATLVERLRQAREQTHRKAMLLSADFATPHRHAILAYDAANEIGLGIAIAKPQNPQGPAPTLRGAAPAPKPAAAPAPPAGSPF
jgi:biopolymer transport protein ExbD